MDENALTLLKERYLLEGESVDEFFERVANALLPGSVEFKKLLTELKFLPNSPALMNAGTEINQLSACFVVPVHDSIESIFDAVKLAALIHKSGGGTGFDFSELRQNGAKVRSTSGVASGPVSFMKVFDAATAAIKQGGRRRGANMGILRVDHPDILEFITCKTRDGEISNFNISVAVTDQFIDCAISKSDYWLIDPYGRKIRKESASKVFELIVHQAWLNGEPGVVFIDRINQYNAVPGLGRLTAVNPCSEQPLFPFESCNLGSIDVSKFVKNGRIDWLGFKKAVRLAVRAMDRIIDINNFPSEEIATVTRTTRKIGLGIMGFADLLLKLRIKYGSTESLKIAKLIARTLNIISKLESIELAKEKGSFPAYDKSIYKLGFLPTKWQNQKLIAKIQKHGIRNATTSTIAPTGSLSIIAGCSSGIEPVFSYFLMKNVLGGKKLVEVNKILLEAAGGAKCIMDPKDYGEWFVTAHEVSPEDHIRVQAAFQEYIDNAISKTINLPHNASEVDVKEAILLAYKLGCKGITVYRDGSRKGQVLSSCPMCDLGGAK